MEDRPVSEQDQKLRLADAMKRLGADVLIEARYAGIEDVKVEVHGAESLDEYHAFEIVRLLAGREQKVTKVFVPQSGREFALGARYWLAAKHGEEWRIV